MMTIEDHAEMIARVVQKDTGREMDIVRVAVSAAFHDVPDVISDDLMAGSDEQVYEAIIVIIKASRRRLLGSPDLPRVLH